MVLGVTFSMDKLIAHLASPLVPIRLHIILIVESSYSLEINRAEPLHNLCGTKSITKTMVYNKHHDEGIVHIVQ